MEKEERFYGLTMKEAFEASACHLLIQGEKSIAESGVQCAYRGKDGLKCAIGCLIPDSEIINEQNNIDTISGFMNDKKIILDPKFENMLTALQRIHDMGNPGDWERSIAKLREKTFYEK